MKIKKQILLMLSATSFVLSSCTEVDSPVIEESAKDTTLDGTNDSTNDEVEVVAATADFTVTIENVVTPKPIFQSGVFAVPVGGTDPAPLFPGDAYEFEIDAGPVVLPGDGGTRLSFVTMFVQSNDLFFAPDEEGISLYAEDGSSICANGPVDVTDQILLWDAGTEVNEVTGGPNQKPQQAPDAADQGEDENGVVSRIVSNACPFGNELPKTEQVIKVTIENIGPSRFKVRIQNVSDAMTISTPGQGAGTTAPVPVSPGVYAVHTMPAPFFVEGEAASGAGLVASMEGLENIAEDGFPEALLMDTQAATGLIVPLSPGVWAVHDAMTLPLYQIDMADFGEGLEAVAEDGIPSMLAASLDGKTGVKYSSAFDTPVGASGPGAIGPGGSYEFMFSAAEGDHLTLATMFVQSNDWFYAFEQDGLPLFVDGVPVSGDLTEMIYLYDAGTEINEYPGAGMFQVIRQSGADAGEPDSNTKVRLIDPSGNIPATVNVIKVTLAATAN